MERVVIVGGGAGGTELAARLAGRRNGPRVTLVDRRSSHLWKPLFHQVAAGTMNSYHDELAYTGLARTHGFRYEFGDLVDVDPDAGHIRLAAASDRRGHEWLPARELRYDRLVLALGGSLNDFGVPGVREHCYTLETREDAQDLNRAFLGALARTAYGHGDRPAQVVIVGGGATGVELAAELCQALSDVGRYGVELPAAGAEILIVERAERLLPPLPPRIASGVASVLDRIGVRVMTGAGVSRVERDSIVLDDGERLPADITVWAAGVKGPNDLHDMAGLTLAGGDRVAVDRRLRMTGSETVFAIGDCAHCDAGEDGAPVPPRAQAARQQAIYLADALPRLMRGQTPEPFRYRDQGSLVSLARYDAFGRLTGSLPRRGITFEGLAAKTMYKLLYRSHQRTLLGTARLLTVMLSDWLRRPIMPRVKLH